MSFFHCQRNLEFYSTVAKNNNTYLSLDILETILRGFLGVFKVNLGHKNI